MEELQKLTEGILQKMGIEDAEVNVMNIGGVGKIQIHLREAGYFIGHNGEHIQDFERIMKLIASRSGIEVRFSVDINNYRSEKEQKLKDYARKVARQVSQTKKEVRLVPMRAYERRIIHLELAAHPDIITESIGEGEGRYIVVKPYP